MAGQLHRASELHRVRTERVRHQAVELRKARSRCEEVRKQYIALWKACKVLHRSLTDEHQAAAKQNLVLDCYRGEYIETAEDPVVAEKRLTRLEQSYATKCRAIANDAERHIARERQAVVDEMTRLEERARAMNELEQDLVRRADSLARQLSELEDQRVHLAQTETHRQQELASERMHHRRYERQVAELRDEVERLAGPCSTRWKSGPWNHRVNVRPPETTHQRGMAYSYPICKISSRRRRMRASCCGRRHRVVRTDAPPPHDWPACFPYTRWFPGR